jgi:DNA-binding GntR family transcriptional regulator
MTDAIDNSAFAEAYRYLRQRIRDGRLRSGARIKADEIAQQLGLSRMPVREAIRQLDSEGLLTIRPNRGAVVTTLDPEEVLELFQMRSVLEGLAVRRAVERFDEDAFDELELRFNRLERAQNDLDQWIPKHNDFHDVICAHSGGRRLFAQVQRLRTAVEPYLRIVLGPAEMGRAVVEHRELIEIIRRRDPDAAEAAMREHIISTRSDLMRVLSAKNP